MLIEKLELETDEQILIQVRKHWFIIGIEIFGIALAAIFPFVFTPVVFAVIRAAGIVEPGNLHASILTALGAAWLLIMWMTLFNTLTNYFLDTWTITTKRLIAIDQRGFSNRSISSFRLERLQDLSVDIRGLIPTLLNFGTLHAQTAGADNQDFKVSGLPDPRKLKEIMLTTSGIRTNTVTPELGKMEI